MPENLDVGQHVKFLHPQSHERRHGRVVSAGAEYVAVKDSPTLPTVLVRRSDVEPDEDAEDWAGCPSRLHSDGG